MKLLRTAVAFVIVAAIIAAILLIPQNDTGFERRLDDALAESRDTCKVAGIYISDEVMQVEREIMTDYLNNTAEGNKDTARRIISQQNFLRDLLQISGIGYPDENGKWMPYSDQLFIFDTVSMGNNYSVLLKGIDSIVYDAEILPYRDKQNGNMHEIEFLVNGNLHSARMNDRFISIRVLLDGINEALRLEGCAEQVRILWEYNGPWLVYVNEDRLEVMKNTLGIRS